MLPRHIHSVPEPKNNEHKAHAPYNFVELPNDIIKIEPETLPQKNCYYSQSDNRYTGKIKCTLTTKSPLYTRFGLIPEDFIKFIDKHDENLKPEEHLEKLRKLANFFCHPDNKRPIISGSSLRGMLRTLVEIISFSKIERVSDQHHFFFRAVAAKKEDPLGIQYKELPKKVKAGYLISEGTSWYIQPSKTIEKSPFIWVKERDLSRISTLIRMDKPNYRPQYISVSFGDTFFTSLRRFTKLVSPNQNLYTNRGMLVTSGNMLESSDNPENLYRKNHCIVPEVNSNANRLKISDTAILDYRSSLTDFQKQEPFDKDLGVLKKGRPVFYCEPLDGQTEVTLFGHCPNFRIPYFPSRDGKAASAVEFIPKSIGKSDKLDLSDAIFGFVRDRDKDTPKKSDTKTFEALAGRVFIEDAICDKTLSDDIWLTGNVDEIVTAKILSTPKPTTFQHYLVQTSSENSQLKHYASQPPTENDSGNTVIRGHKLYWHKRNVKREDIEETDHNEISKARSQYTEIKPIKEGVIFNFNIHFENLNNVELGALLWILNKAQDDQYCLSLGMGKPLGMGAIKITHQLQLSDRSSRYSRLFNHNQWLTGEEDQTDIVSKHADCVQAFEDYVLNNIHDDDHPQGCKAKNLEELPRIQMLLAMLRWDVTPKKDETRYMTIKPNNEYTERPVLPTPLQIFKEYDEKFTDNRRFPPQSVASSQVTEKSKKNIKDSQQNTKRGNSGDRNNYNAATARPTKPPKPPKPKK
ncbi:hypothetical protein NIES4103_06440 [Nostoc sp. NIES-4103]|nr:hypothetical protein NIES4103_06440 [Nostoc sp. NIES-4103]